MSLYGAPIDRFDGTEFAFLSNFYDHFIEGVEPILYVLGEKRFFVPTVEHCYQADKAVYLIDAERVLLASTPGKAKRIGRAIACRSDWDAIKITRMAYWLDIKFANPYLGNKLIEMTGDRDLIEGNTWGDKFWGKVDGDGENWLGRLLMDKRDRLRKNQ